MREWKPNTCKHLFSFISATQSGNNKRPTTTLFQGFSVSLCNHVTSEGEMLNTSAILAYSSLTLVNPWMRPVGLPWASWVWKMSLGLGYSGGSVGGGEGGGSGGAVGSVHPWFWAFWSSMALTTTALDSYGLISSPLRPPLRFWWAAVAEEKEKNRLPHL